MYRGLFPLIPGKLSHKEGYDIGTLDFGPETEQEKEKRLKNPFYEDTPKLKFPNNKMRQEKAAKMYQVTYLSTTVPNLLYMLGYIL